MADPEHYDDLVALITDKINAVVNVPVLNEEQERIVIEALVKLLLSLVHMLRSK